MDASSSTSSTVPLEGCSGVNQSPFAVGPTLASPGQVREGAAGQVRATVKILVSRLPMAARPGRGPAGRGRAGRGRRRRGPASGRPRRSASTPAAASSSPPATTRTGPARGVATRRPVPAGMPSSSPELGALDRLGPRPGGAAHGRRATRATPRASRASPTTQRPRPRVAATATSSTSPSRASAPRGARSLPVSSAAPSRADADPRQLDRGADRRPGLPGPGRRQHHPGQDGDHRQLHRPPPGGRRGCGQPPPHLPALGYPPDSGAPGPGDGGAPACPGSRRPGVSHRRQPPARAGTGRWPSGGLVADRASAAATAARRARALASVSRSSSSGTESATTPAPAWQ